MRVERGEDERVALVDQEREGEQQGEVRSDGQRGRERLADADRDRLLLDGSAVREVPGGALGGGGGPRVGLLGLWRESRRGGGQTDLPPPG